MPSSQVFLKEGDIISIDCGTILNGFVGDSAYTYCVGEVAEETKQLLRTTKEALYEGIRQAIVYHRVGDISDAVQTYCQKRGYSVVRELVGHGCGRKMHEAPEVPNFGRRGCGPLLKSGMTICIEPMINKGSKNVVVEKDGWTVRTKDCACSAHFEHCIAIRPEGPMILSTFDYVEEVTGKEI
jgi:methionyl aminopeptidase